MRKMAFSGWLLIYGGLLIFFGLLVTLGEPGIHDTTGIASLVAGILTCFGGIRARAGQSHRALLTLVLGGFFYVLLTQVVGEVGKPGQHEARFIIGAMILLMVSGLTLLALLLHFHAPGKKVH